MTVECPQFPEMQPNFKASGRTSHSVTVVGCVGVLVSLKRQFCCHMFPQFRIFSNGIKRMNLHAQKTQQLAWVRNALSKMMEQTKKHRECDFQ